MILKGEFPMLKLIEQTNGNHIYMKMMLDNKRIEEIDVFYDNNGKETYRTSADHGNHVEIRKQIIDTFNKLY
jgi:hypothetical protein